MGGYWFGSPVAIGHCLGVPLLAVSALSSRSAVSMTRTTLAHRIPGQVHFEREPRTGTRTRSLPRVQQSSTSEERNEIYEAAKNADYQIPKLQALAMAELLGLARKMKEWRDTPGVTKQELIFQAVASERVTNSGLGWGEGYARHPARTASASCDPEALQLQRRSRMTSTSARARSVRLNLKPGSPARRAGAPAEGRGEVLRPAPTSRR